MLFLSGCSSVFEVKSDPQQADVFVQDRKSGDKKPIGKTPLALPKTELRRTVGDVKPGEFITIVVEKQGFIPQSFNVPATGFGAMGTLLDVKLKEGNNEREARIAKDILDRLFLAQKFALSQQFERAHMELDKIVEQFPTFTRALSMRASIYYAQKNYAESLRWYEEALKLDPQMDDAVRMAAKVRGLVGGRLPASSAPLKEGAAPSVGLPGGSK